MSAYTERLKRALIERGHTDACYSGEVEECDCPLAVLGESEPEPARRSTAQVSGVTVRELPFAELPDYANRLARASIGWRVLLVKRGRVIVIRTDRDLTAYEDSTEDARALLIRAVTDAPTVAEIVAADDALKRVLTGTDRFWLRWSGWRDDRLPEDHPSRAVYG